MGSVTRRNFLRSASGLLVTAPFVANASNLMSIKPTDPTWSASELSGRDLNSLLVSYRRQLEERFGQRLVECVYEIYQQSRPTYRIIVRNDRIFERPLLPQRAVS